MLAALVLLTLADIVGRYWFNSPISGAFELTQIMLAMLIFLALPLTTFDSEHVEVDIFYRMATPLYQTLMRIFSSVCSLFALSVMAWQLGIKAQNLSHDEAVSDALSFPLSIIGWVGAGSAAISAVMALLLLTHFSAADEVIHNDQKGDTR
jgi:TRAP-type C4-dicarboxylate transport system permease small subunit